MRYSIKKRLFLSAAIVLSAVALLSGGVVWQLSELASDEAYDRVLGAAALSISDTITISDTAVSVDLPYASFAILGTSGMNRIFYRVVDPDGNLVTGNPVLGIEQPLLNNSKAMFFDSRYRDQKIRVAQVAQFHQGSGGGGWFNVFVGETREARDQLSQRLTMSALFPAMLAILLGAILLVLAIRSSFAPLREIEETLRRRSPSDMTPINPNAPEEVAALIEAINLFMGRLDATLNGLRRVTADAAHQLRTPLAAMRAVSELAMDADPEQPVKEYVQRIHSNAILATNLANQLMTEARLLHSMESGAMEEINLLTLTKKTLRRAINEWRFLCDMPDISFQSDRLTNPVLQGNETALTELIKNLLENAVQHGRGPISIILSDRVDQVILRIQDRGPGLPEAIQDRVFERFVKNPENRQGTGLGLAIVKQIVAASSGKICISKRAGGGLEAEVRLPRWHPKAQGHEQGEV